MTDVTSLPLIPDADISVAFTYVWKDGVNGGPATQWKAAVTNIGGGGGGIADAPANGVGYLRRNGAWTAFIAAPGGNLHIVLTQAEYDALSPPDPDTFYYIPEAE